MDKKQENKLKRILIRYFKKIHEIYIGGDFREESFYPELKTLIENCSQLFDTEANVLVLPKKKEAGIPDFRIGKNEEIIGYIEAKTTDTDLNDIEDSEQLKRYRESLENLILTNFLEFRLYKNGELLDKVEVGRKLLLRDLEHPPVPENIDSFSNLLEKFFSYSTPKTKNSSELSIALAKRTRFLDHLLQEELNKGNKEVTRFYKAFQEELIENLTEQRFADLYAQTITYGLFAARMRVSNGFNRSTAWKFIPESLPLLKEIFYSMTGPHFPESMTWIVDDISQVLETADISSIMKEFNLSMWDEDPVIHFYETFLATYNPKERQRLGVYYTPLPVVSYIVRSIHLLLKNKFNKNEGLATTDVTLLDPAAGTLTFVVQAIKQVQKELEKRNKTGLIRSYIKDHIIPHFNAFEILVAPYTIGHFKVAMILEEMGYEFERDERFHFYLTNTLEMKEPTQGSFLIELAKEGEEAKKIKEKPILVILGNPPYSVSSENKSLFIDGGKVPEKSKTGKVLKYRYVPGLMDDYKEDVKDEKNIQPLSDDYIKFIRFAHWKIDQAGKGILAFITNNSYLSGIIHRGMRKKLLESFDKIYILNLHGSSRIGEKTPEGTKDENVFDIQQGVAIAIYVKLETPREKTKIYYADVWGLREEKYDYLFNNDIETTKWQEIEPENPDYFLIPTDFSLKSEYNGFWKITEIFNKWSSGVKTHRDHFIVGFTEEELVQRLRIFIGDLPEDLIKETLKLKDTRDWKFIEAREKVTFRDLINNIYPYSYRPFDCRKICYELKLIDRGCDRWNLMKHFLKENKAIATSRSFPTTKNFGALISTQIGDIHFVADQTYFFPLYLYKVDTQENLPLEEEGKKAPLNPNFKKDFLIELRNSLKIDFSPDQVFYYIYSILYSPFYRNRYIEFLQKDFPKVPLPLNSLFFIKLSDLGKKLVKIHMLKHPELNETGIGFPVEGTNKVIKESYSEENIRVYINKKQYFEGVSKEVWEYHVGAYQVMKKYLKDRRRRELSLEEINHYMKIAKAIELTIETQSEIDDVFIEMMKIR